MALESVTAAETLIQSNNNEDLEDGEIPSDEDDEPVVPAAPVKVTATPPSKHIPKSEPPKNKNFDSKFNKNKKQSVQGSSKPNRFSKYKNPSEDWAGDVEKAIRAALEEDKVKNQESKSKNKNNRNKNRKRIREEKEEDRIKEQKRRKLSDEDDGNEDDDEMLFVRGASPVRKDSRENNSSPRRANEHENFDSNSDYEERSTLNRHRENDSKRGGGRGGGRRGGKNDRGGKNKGRGQMRNDRNSRRNQSNDHGQDPDAICLYYMQGKCHRGDDCPFSHNALPPRKMELCKFYLMDCCAKRDKCLYMHHDFPCKFFHTGLKCNQGENCKFSHEPLNEQVKNILLKHLETAPKEILGDFPRLSREGAMLMINNTARTLSQGQDISNQKIPSLFELNLPAPINSTNKMDGKEEDVSSMDIEGSPSNHQKNMSSIKERKPTGKKTRWGSDEDRVPYEQIMLLQSANQLGLQLPNAALGLAVQQQLQQQILLQQRIANMGFYNEANANPNDPNKNSDKEDFTKDVEEDEIVAQARMKEALTPAVSKDVDLRQLLTTSIKPPPVVSIADEVANLTNSKLDEESDRDEETDLIIEMPIDEDEKDREKEINKQEDSQASNSSNEFLIPKLPIDDREIPSHLPKRAQELFMRIQQQQRAAQDSFKNMEDERSKDNMEQTQEDWYSDDEEDDDDDDDDGGNLTIVLKDVQKEESEHNAEGKENVNKDKSPSVVEPSSIPQPAVIADKLGDLSKIDISAEVTKLLSSIKAHSSTNNKSVQNQPVTDFIAKDTSQSKLKFDQDLYSRPTNSNGNYENDSKNGASSYFGVTSQQLSKVEDKTSSPAMSPGTGSSVSAVSRDPRMSRDPRQRREEQKPSSPNRTNSKKELKQHKIENSIYSSGIIAMDANMDIDLRSRGDQDHRRKDMDLRQQFPTDFGDTDLRIVGGNFVDVSTKSDVDLRQMLSLPFKPAPSHMPCTEIDASISSHPPIAFKVYVVDIPRPDYTGLKLTKNDPQVKYDPRLRKIFRLSKTDLADSPMSPPPTKLDTPKSPPQVRSDPRRKALEASNQSAQSSTSAMQIGPPQQQPSEMSNMNMGPQGLSGPQGMPMPMGPNPMLGNMGPMGPMMGGMGPNGPMIGGPIPPSNIPPMGMSGMSNMSSGMGPNGPVMSQSQMNYDPRYNAQRNNGAGLLGPAPGLGFGPDVGPSYDGPNFSGGNFNNFGPGPGPTDSTMMGFGPNGPNASNFGGNGSEWNGGNQTQSRRGGRVRRRNRNRTNATPSNRGNRSPP